VVYEVAHPLNKNANLVKAENMWSDIQIRVNKFMVELIALGIHKRHKSPLNEIR